MRKYILIFVAALCGLLIIQFRQISELKKDRDAYRTTAEALLRNVDSYRTEAGLNVAKVQQMSLTLDEYRRYRAEDAKTIESLRVKLRNVQTINKTQMESVYLLDLQLRDSVRLDSLTHLPDTLRCLSYHDDWLDFEGCLDADRRFRGSISSREELIYVESVIYRRFLGFLWRTRKVERREQDIVSRNPHTTIIDAEYISIRK